MTLPVPPNSGLSPEEARSAGRQLAEHPLLAARAGDQRPQVADVLADARPLLATYGITFEIVRTRPGCVVLRSRPDKIRPEAACELVKTMLGEVAGQVCGVKASLVESTCAQRGAPACVYSLLWDDQPAGGLRPPPGPETLIDPAPSVAFPAYDADVPALPEWNRPSAEPGTPYTPSASVPVQPTEPAPRPATATAPRPAEAVVPTGAASTAHHFQASTPNAIVMPAPAVPAATQAVPAATQAVPAAPALTPVRRHFPRGLLRRSWLLAAALVAGSAGGWFAGVHAATSFSAQATVVVQSGSGRSGPGSANDALALATTYAALIPKDQSILSAAAGSLNTSTSAVGHALSVTVENGTSILLINYSAPSASRAVAGAEAVAHAVASSTPVTPAIGAGSVAIVSVPSAAHLQGTLHKYGIVFGGFLGLVVGLILVLAAERADPRIDDAPTLATASGCRAALVPADLSFPELARVLSDSARSRGPLTVVPISVSDTGPTMELARGLRPCWPADGPAVQISPAFATGVVDLTRGTGPTVLVSHEGTRQRDVLAAAERLRMMGRAPVWAVLVTRRFRSRVSDRVG